MFGNLTLSQDPDSKNTALLLDARSASLAVVSASSLWLFVRGLPLQGRQGMTEPVACREHGCVRGLAWPSLFHPNIIIDTHESLAKSQKAG